MTLILYIAFYHFLLILLLLCCIIIGDDYDKVNTSEDNIRFLLNDKYINFIDSYLYIPIHYWYDRYMDMDR